MGNWLGSLTALCRSLLADSPGALNSATWSACREFVARKVEKLGEGEAWAAGGQPLLLGVLIRRVRKCNGVGRRGDWLLLGLCVGWTQ